MKEIKPGYFVISKYGKYTIIKRETDFEPYIVTYNLQEDSKWDFGHYFSDLFSAVDYAKAHADESHISYIRMSEIASKAIVGLFEDDSESAYEYLINEIEMDEIEMKYFGVKEKCD